MGSKELKVDQVPCKMWAVLKTIFVSRSLLNRAACSSERHSIISAFCKVRHTWMIIMISKIESCVENVEPVRTLNSCTQTPQGVSASENVMADGPKPHIPNAYFINLMCADQGAKQTLVLSR